MDNMDALVRSFSEPENPVPTQLFVLPKDIINTLIRHNMMKSMVLQDERTGKTIMTDNEGLAELTIN